MSVIECVSCNSKQQFRLFMKNSRDLVSRFAAYRLKYRMYILRTWILLAGSQSLSYLPSLLNMTSTAIAPKRFRFNEELDLVLLRCIGLNNAHMAGYGEAESKWDEVLSMFCAAHEAVPRLEVGGFAAPKACTITERFMLLIRERRAEVRRNLVSSSIAEKFCEREEFLDS